MSTQKTGAGLINTTRRGFLQSTGAIAGGLVLGFHLGEGEAEAATGAEFNAFIAIAPDSMVTLQIHKSEMGQGVVTSLSQILIDELDGDWTKFRTEFPGVKPVYATGMQGTYGSLSIRSSFKQLRGVAAQAREMLKEAAAAKWNVPAAQVRTENGFAINSVSNARLSYGELADAAAKITVRNAPQKNPSAWKLIGTSPQRVDTPGKTRGTTPFGMDYKMAGMVYAAIERCPVFEGKVKSFDVTKAKTVPGFKDAFSIGSGVVVLADNTWAAFQAKKALTIAWDEGPRAGNSTQGLRQMFADMAKNPGTSVLNTGDVDPALSKAAHKLEAVYEAPYLSHAPMEPLNATVLVTASKCDIWVGTQIQSIAQQAAAQVTGLKPDQIEIHTQYLGGGFGRRGGDDYIHEAVQVANQVKGTPVKVVWTREDDLQHDTYRPMSYTKFWGGLDAEGWPVALHARVVCPPFGGVSTQVEGIQDLKYAIANVRVEAHSPDVGVPVSYWRSVGYSQNTFFLESFIDEMAAATGKDPLEFRRKLLAKQPRLLNVLNLAAEKAGWGKPLPAGHFHGIGIADNIGSFNAQVAEVSVTNNKVKVHKVVCAIDCGIVVNPAIVRQQIESGIVFGLGPALKHGITLERGRVTNTNFNSYDPLRIDEMPQVEVHIVESKEDPGGIGEASTPATPPAVLNAVYAATKKRVRVLPAKDLA